MASHSPAHDSGRGEEAVAVRRHIDYKESARELAGPVAARMREALDAGAAPDYAALLEAATFLPPPARCYHTAPVTVRDQIAASGLRPGTGENWDGAACGQPAGVYVGPTPDTIGKWAHANTWDVWQIDMTGLVEGTGDLEWAHDRLNPGCWLIRGTVPVERLTLHLEGATYPA